MNSNKEIPSPAWWLSALGRVPLPLMYAIGSVLAVLMRDVLRYRVKVARDNLREAMPELDEAARRRVLRRHYRVFADVLFELPRVAVMSSDELERRVSLPDLAQLRDEYERGHPVLLLIGHQCNWEWLLQAVALKIGVPFVCAYKPPHSERADQLMLAVRSRFGAMLVPGKRLIRDVLRRRGSVHAIGMVADQMPTSSAGRVWLRFLGRETAFFPGPAEIARAGSYSAYFLALRRLRRGHYEAHLEALCAAGENLGNEEFTARYAARVEALIRESPEDWAWTHRRWKLQRLGPEAVANAG